MDSLNFWNKLFSEEGHFLWYKEQPDKDDGGLEGHAPKKGKQVD